MLVGGGRWWLVVAGGGCRWLVEVGGWWWWVVVGGGWEWSLVVVVGVAAGPGIAAAAGTGAADARMAAMPNLVDVECVGCRGPAAGSAGARAASIVVG